MSRQGLLVSVRAGRVTTLPNPPSPIRAPSVSSCGSMINFCAAAAAMPCCPDAAELDCPVTASPAALPPLPAVR